MEKGQTQPFRSCAFMGGQASFCHWFMVSAQTDDFVDAVNHLVPQITAFFEMITILSLEFYSLISHVL